MKLIAISAVSIDGVIGIDDQIPWYVPEDFKHFRKTTINNVLLVGRKTFLTLPDKALEKRDYLILGHEPIKDLKPNCRQFNSVDTVLNYIKDSKIETVFLIGGSMIYNELIEMCDEVILTWVNKKYPNGNKRFPLVKLFSNFDLVTDQEWQTSISELEYKITYFVKNPNKCS